jgi:hypothetical protein
LNGHWLIQTEPLSYKLNRLVARLPSGDQSSNVSGRNEEQTEYQRGDKPDDRDSPDNPPD